MKHLTMAALGAVAAVCAASIPARVMAQEAVCGLNRITSTTLSLNDDRFHVTAQWRAPGGLSGPGQAVQLTADSGYFWFFSDDNVELVVKVLDACGLPGFNNYWVFAAGLTDVEVTLKVKDSFTDEERVYVNPLGSPFLPIQDVAAFDTCAALFEIGFPELADGRFVIALTDPIKIEQARRAIADPENNPHSVMGLIVKEPRDYNPLWSYHLDPSTIEFFDNAIEVCDAAPRYVEEHLAEACGEFLPGCRWCPWSSQVVAEIEVARGGDREGW